MTSLRETCQESLALVHKVVAVQKKVSHCFSMKSVIMEWIKSILEIVFEFILLKMTDGHAENRF